jgi:hypothetical protein
MVIPSFFLKMALSATTAPAPVAMPARVAPAAMASPELLPGTVGMVATAAIASKLPAAAPAGALPVVAAFLSIIAKYPTIGLAQVAAGVLVAPAVRAVRASMAEMVAMAVLEGILRIRVRGAVCLLRIFTWKEVVFSIIARGMAVRVGLAAQVARGVTAPRAA